MTYVAPASMQWQMDHNKDVVYLISSNGQRKSDEQLLNDRVPSLTELERACPLRGIDAFSPGAANLGTTLDALPLELQHVILLQLDLASFLEFRKVNKHAMAVADTVVEYEKVSGSSI